MSGVLGHPAPRPALPRYNEGSPLRSPRDEDGAGRQWVKARVTNDQTAALAEQVKQLQIAVNRLQHRPRMMPVVNLHPFQIHSSPKEPGGTWETDRLHFRVHSGYISALPNSATGSGTYTTPEMRAVYKTDGLGSAYLVEGESWIIDDVRDEVQGECPAYDAENIDFTITDGIVNYVWIDNTDTWIPTITVGPLASVPDDLKKGSIIVDDYALIGYIDATGDRTVVKQFIRTDIVHQSSSASADSVAVRMYAFVSWHEEYMVCYYVGLQLTAVHRESGGTGYEVGDIVSFATSGSDLPVSILITAVDENGVPTAFTILDGGQFASEPASPDALEATGGSGTGLILHGTFGANTTPVYVALQPELRESYNPESLDITYPDPPDQTRIVTIDEEPEDQIVQPKLLAGDLVPVMSCVNTGVVDPGNPLVGLTLLAVTGREWAKVYEPPA
jgi:hypothetical protein